MAQNEQPTFYWFNSQSCELLQNIKSILIVINICIVWCINDVMMKNIVKKTQSWHTSSEYILYCTSFPILTEIELPTVLIWCSITWQIFSWPMRQILQFSVNGRAKHEKTQRTKNGQIETLPVSIAIPIKSISFFTKN